MTHTKDPMDRLQLVLSSAHRTKAHPSDFTGRQWRQHVMQSVRRVGVLHPDANSVFKFPQLAWRLAPAALALMILLAVMIMKIGDSLEFHLVGLMVSDPVQTYIPIEPL